ncbi:hypothetical protein DXG03_009104, partial [Asterophora parasitica]
LVKKLHSVNEGLKKFAHVNKKAFEQYSNFTKQRDQLLQRREDLDKSATSIEELVEILDQRKDEAIERTFKQVASNFEEVFEKLVPAGRGRLIIQRRIDQDEEDEDEETQQSTIDNYTGVSIKVSFNSKVDEGLRIQQLSGGQKSLVALATVFAIQKCDPAPFYLFDEIDANLDAQYRTAVASMIQSLASTAQFITTTFRPEMLVTADKFYGVLFNNQKVSSIRAIKREEAMEFVDQLNMELVSGGLYVFMTMRADVGDCHWGLYLHHSTTIVASPPTEQSNRTLPPAPTKRRTIHRGKKYHVRNLGEGYMPDHQIVGDMLSTLFLVGLLRIGTVQDPAISDVDSIISALDEQVHELSRGNSIYCRTWVVGNIRALVEKGVLATDARDEAIWAHIEEFGEREWESAEKAVQPRPIMDSSLFA